MNRREFLECSVLLIGGLSASQLGWTLSDEQRRHLATAPPYTDREPAYFNDAQRRAVAAIAEAIIPRTDTPGAIDAGVPRYIELMVEGWFNDQERAIFDAGLAGLMDGVQQRHGRAFEGLDAALQREELEALEAAAEGAPWYGSSTDVFAGFDSDNPFICQLKELTIWGFFTSEVGATQVLRYNPMPMRFDGDLPLSPEDSSWSGGLL